MRLQAGNITGKDIEKKNGYAGTSMFAGDEESVLHEGPSKLSLVPSLI